jgi:hypothetical protein
MEIIKGKIKNVTQQGEILIMANYDNIDRFTKRKYSEVEIGLNDGRTISLKQRKAIHAFIGAIAEYSGDMPNGIKHLMKMKFLTEQYNGLAKKMFSLSDCDMTLARDFTKYLIDFCLDFGVPLNFDLFKFIGDDRDMVAHWVYSCIKHKQCTVCGNRGELHHIDTVGMGNDRTEIIHEGMEAMCLCRVHHGEYHNTGKTAFCDKYHIDGGIKLDKELCKIWKLKAVAV